MLGGSWACSLKKILKKKCNLVRFDVSLPTILGPPRQVPSHAICGPTQVRFLASWHTIWGLPRSEQFLRIDYGGPLRSVYSLIMGASILMYFFILYGGPSDHFYAQYIGAPRSLSSLSIWSPSDHFLLIQYGGPSQITFIVYYMGPPSDHFLCIIFWGPLSDHFFSYYMGPLRSVSSPTIWGSPEISFFTYYIRAPLRLVSSLTNLYGGPIRSVSFHTIWGPPQVSFFAYYMGTSLCQFLRLLCGPP